jgi:PilZ domain-containing protein
MESVNRDWGGMAFLESKFQGIMSSLRSDVQKTDEKRRSPRVGVGVRGTILVHSTRKILNVYVRDLSLGGVGITCEHAIESGDHFSLLLTKPDAKPTHVLYEVRHCRMAMTGIFDIGAQQVPAQTVHTCAKTQDAASQTPATAPNSSAPAHV